MLRVAVGSTNPAKLAAARHAFDELHPGAYELHAIACEVGDAQPWGEDATCAGAIERARIARTRAGADWGIGMEGGLLEDAHGVLVTSWVAVVGAGEEPTLARTAGFYLPPAIAGRVRAGQELGAALQAASDSRATGRGAGTVGWLTGGRIDRSRLYSEAVVLAMGLAQNR